LRWALASVRDYRVCQDRHAALVGAIAPAIREHIGQR